MYGSDIRRNPVSIHSGAGEVYSNVTGYGTEFDSSRVKDVDDRLGYRPGQPYARQTVRIPRSQIIFKITPGSKNVELLRPLTNVTSISLTKLHITGLTPGDTGLALAFDGGSEYGRSMRPASNVLLGMPNVPTNSIVMEVEDPLSTSLFLNPGQPLYFAQYMKPQNIENVSVRLLNLNGEERPFTQILVWMDVVTEVWQ